MNEIIFKDWKTRALKCKEKDVGRIISTYYRLHYDEHADTVSLWQRPFDRKNTGADLSEIYRKKYHIFTIDNTSTLTLHVLSINLDQSLKACLNKELNLYLTAIPAAQQEKYTMRSPHSFRCNFKDFIYVPNQTVFNTYGELIKAGTYGMELIDETFNKKLTKLSKIFREKLNVVGNLCDLHLTKAQVFTRGKNTDNFIEFALGTKEIYEDLQLKIVTPKVFSKWQKYSYLFTAFSYKKNKTPTIDVRKESQKGINKARKSIAKMQNKIKYIQVKQDDVRPGTR